MEQSSPLGRKLAAYAERRRQEIGPGFPPDEVAFERLRSAVRGRFGEGVGAHALAHRWENGLWLRAGGALVGGIAVVTGAALLLGRGEGPVAERPDVAVDPQKVVTTALPAVSANAPTETPATPSKTPPPVPSAKQGAIASSSPSPSKPAQGSGPSSTAALRGSSIAKAPSALPPDWQLSAGPAALGDPKAQEDQKRNDFFALLGIDVAETKPVVAETKPVVAEHRGAEPAAASSGQKKGGDAKPTAPAKSSWLTLNLNLNFSLGSGKEGASAKNRAGSSLEKAVVPAARPAAAAPAIEVAARSTRVTAGATEPATARLSNPEPAPPRVAVSAPTSAAPDVPGKPASRVIPDAANAGLAGGGATSVGEQRYVRDDPARHLRRNFNSPPLPEVLQEFVIRKRANGMAIVDADGSVYEVVPEETLGLVDRGGVPRTAQSSVCFKAAGLHKSSGEWVIFDGWLVPAKGDEGEPAPGVKGMGSQWAAVPGMPLGGMRVRGEVRLGERTRFPLAADPVAKQGS